MTIAPPRSLGASSWLHRHHDVVILLGLALVPLLLTPRMGGAGYITAVTGSAALLLNVVGMMLIYRVDGYLNFAQIQFGLLGAAVFDV